MTKAEDIGKLFHGKTLIIKFTDVVDMLMLRKRIIFAYCIIIINHELQITITKY